MQNGSIQINDVLEQIDHSYDDRGNPKSFMLTFSDKNGKRSTRKFIKRVKHKGQRGKSPGNSNFKYNIRDNYSLHLYEVGVSYKSIFIPTIEYFNGLTVFH